MPETPQAPPPSEPKIEALLNAAIAAAVAAFEGQRPTPSTLARMGQFARDAVCVQADLGMWREWTIADHRDFDELQCTFEIRSNGLLAPQYIAPVWDFRGTPLKFLATSPAQPPVRA